MDAKHGTRPMVVEEIPGKKAYCQCGHSEKLPYCDGAHSRLGTGLKPIVLDIPDAGTKAVCQCHQSGNKPWCDGTHSKIGKS
ncbi:MAG TPA: CDGSH iron-sulfur domain-containing protein [Phycisphaerae bacterium]|nr:CDGSH iron-sulfur domain-containing protein [Phycisphaerae bacterium]